MVDPVTISLILAGLLGISALMALRFWTNILRWANDIVFPWVEENIPWATNDVRRAFDAVDKVATPVRRAVRKAWRNLRNYLLKQVVELRRKSANAWVMKTTTWLVKVLESGEQVPVKKETTSTIPWEEVPGDVRAEFLRNGLQESDLNVTKLRDKEMEQVAVAG